MSQIDHPNDRAALDAFLNAALREGRLGRPRFTPDALHFEDPEGRAATVAIRARSRFRVLFDGPARRFDHGAWRTLPIEALLSDLARPGGETFRARVLDSLSAIRRAPPASGDAERWSFVEAEQALKAGHPLHPNPRSRDEMSAEAAAAYAPEQGGRFGLVWLRAKREDVAASPGCGSRLRGLLPPRLAAEPDETLIPCHPWQAERLLEREAPRRRVEAGRLAFEPEPDARWTATASMRTLHAWRAPYMLKLSLSLRLTNSTRVLRMREVARGLQISALMETPLGAEIRAAFPRLRLLAEPGWAALRAEDGSVMEESLVVLRDNPFRDPARPGPVMLASLCEAPAEGPSPLGALIGRLARGVGREETALGWFDRFLEVAIHPLLEIRARWGLLFGAHQQNMMLDLEGGWPATVWVRDCQGTGHLAAFHERLAAACPGIGEGAENVVDVALGDGLLAYYVVVNGVFNTIAAIALDGLASETALIGRWRGFLERARAACPGDRAVYDTLLEAPALACKGNFSTSLSGVNEADGHAGGQVAAFFDLPNPLLRMEPA